MAKSKINYGSIKTILLEPAGLQGKGKIYPWIGLLLGAMVGFLVVHPISMLVRNIHNFIYSGAPLELGPALLHSFHTMMWPMMALYTFFGALVGIILGLTLKRLSEKRQLLDTLHQEFEIQVATLRHNYKNLAIGIQGFAGRIRGKLEGLGKQLHQCAQDDSLIYEEFEALARNVEILEEASQRLTQTLGQELFFLKALTSSSLTPALNDIYPLLRRAIKDLLELRFRDKKIRVEINGQPWEQCQESLVFAFEPYTLEVILQNILSNAMKHGDFIQVQVGETDRWILVGIQDNGPGLEVEKLRLSLLAPADRQSTESSHLGLKVSLHLMAKSGGHISIGSNPGGGALFVLDFPRKPSLSQNL